MREDEKEEREREREREGIPYGFLRFGIHLILYQE